MRIGYLNTQRGLDDKVDVLESTICDGFEIFGVGEIDLDPDSVPPLVEGYSTVTHRNSDGYARLCVYIKNTITVDDSICPVDLPIIILQLAQVTIAFAYKGFTINPYCKNKRRITDKERCNIAIDSLDKIASMSKKHLIIQGDFNIDYLSNTISKRRIANWALDNDCTQIITSPTRLSKTTNTCLDLCFCRLNNSRRTASTFDSLVSDHLGICLSFGRIKPTQVRRSATKWSITPDIRKFAHENPLNVEYLENCELEKCASTIVDWLQVINNMATKGGLRDPAAEGSSSFRCSDEVGLSLAKGEGNSPPKLLRIS